MKAARSLRGAVQGWLGPAWGEWCVDSLVSAAREHAGIELDYGAVIDLWCIRADARSDLLADETRTEMSACAERVRQHDWQHPELSRLASRLLSEHDAAREVLA